MDTRDLRAGPISCEVFVRAFLHIFFPMDKKEAKVEYFINVRQGGMSVLEYSLKFTKLSKYSSSVVFNLRDQMNYFVIGVSDDIVEECRLAMLHNNMDISRSMMHAQHVWKSMLKRKNREFKREWSY